MPSIYAIQSTPSGVALNPVWSQDGGDAFTAMATAQVVDLCVLFAYNNKTGKTGVYVLKEEAPWIEPSVARVDLSGGPYDNLTSFVLGNDPYLMAYRKDSGTFSFYRINRDLSISKPYSFALPRNTPTHGFTMVAPYSSLGLPYFAGYSVDTGIVANFNLAVTCTSPDGVPPLQALNVWYHQWAKGWSHFAWFQLGGANFFFKINRDKLNVNIDHMQDNPAMGSVEVGSYLQAKLPDALLIDSTAAIPWENGEPYLLTYIASSGKTVVYRIHADCQGWTSLSESSTVKGATETIAYRVGNTSFALIA
jgi:hypothetical protein